jgi:nicotinate-nucleotide pyrophosphorylase (carboxylating)
LSADLRDTIFASLGGRRFNAEIRPTTPGLVCGVDLARAKVAALGCEVLSFLDDGATAMAGQVILALRGTAKALAQGEDCVPGAIAKPSGIARAALKARDLAAGKVRIVSGACKKMPEEVKPQIRHAIHCGGGIGCIASGPFVYLDKNYVRMFGGVRAALAAVAEMKGFTRVVQLRGLVEPIAVEALAALEMGAEILMVDTGLLEDLDRVSALVRERGRREATTLAFAGDIELADIPAIARHDVDILDIGRAIIDAPSVDLKFDVAGEA